jgi:hypothetical protein
VVDAIASGTSKVPPTKVTPLVPPLISMLRISQNESNSETILDEAWQTKKASIHFYQYNLFQNSPLSEVSLSVSGEV